jgi:hypothetical protein
MGKQNLNISLGCLLLTLTSVTKAQVKISGEIRPRSEYRHGFKTLHNGDNDAAFFTEQRTRLILNYENENFFTTLSLQDVRIWGAVDQVYKSDPSLTSVHQAFAGFNVSPEFAILAGRMELDYDNARIFGNLGWAQQSRSHDLLKLVYTDSIWALHIGAAFNQDSQTPEFRKLNSTFYNGTGNYKTMQYAWFNTKAKPFNISLLAMNQGIQSGTADTSDVAYNQTFGTHTLITAGKLKASLEFYYQTGEMPTGTDLSAYMAGASLSYPITPKFPITLGVDHLSGTKAGSEKNNSFNPFYGTNHKFYGFMDYFYVGNPHSNVGLTDLYLQTKLAIVKKSNLIVHFHQFLSAVPIPDPADSQQTLGSSLGTEIDIVYSLNISEAVNLTAGYSQMFTTGGMEAIKSGGGSKDENTNWAWLMLTFKPVFFSSK